MRRNKMVVALVTAALVGVVGAEGIIKARNAALPRGTVIVEDVDSVVVEANRLDSASEQPPTVVSAM